MHWGAPAYAGLLLLLPPALLFAHRAARRRRQDVARLAGEGGAASGWPLRAGLALAVACLLVVAALCRPQWGRMEVREQARGVDVVVAMDVSRSMLADDAAPHRLSAAKRALGQLLTRLDGDRIGLIAFAGSAFQVCPLTADYAVFASVLDETGPESMPLGGSQLAGALRQARTAFDEKSERARFLVVVSDFEDHGEEAVAAAAELRRRGVRVFGAGVGTDEGGLIPLERGELLRDREGKLVKTRLNRERMAAVAEAGGGRVLDLGADPGALAGFHAAEMLAAERRVVAKARQQAVERYQWPLGLALLLLVAEPFLRRRAP